MKLHNVLLAALLATPLQAQTGFESRGFKTIAVHPAAQSPVGSAGS